MLTTRQERKAQVRISLLAAAARRLKRFGIVGTSVQRVMADAKLTHGSFYAYFRTKDHLVSESLRFALEQTTAKLEASLPRSLSGRERLSKYLDFYLSPAHRLTIEDGCPIAALSRDVSQANARLRKEYAKELETLVARRIAFFGDDSGELTRERWLGILSCCVGALILSRSVEGHPLSEDFLRAARKMVGEV